MTGVLDQIPPEDFTSSHDLIALEDLEVRNQVRNCRLATAISHVGWSRPRRWVEYYRRLQEGPVAPPPEYTTQDCSGVLPDGSPCRQRIRKSLSARTHNCPRCGLVLDRDQNAAAVNRQRGLALART
jgi:putative transposase